MQNQAFCTNCLEIINIDNDRHLKNCQPVEIIDLVGINDKLIKLLYNFNQSVKHVINRNLYMGCTAVDGCLSQIIAENDSIDCLTQLVVDLQVMKDCFLQIQERIDNNQTYLQHLSVKLYELSLTKITILQEFLLRRKHVQTLLECTHVINDDQRSRISSHRRSLSKQNFYTPLKSNLSHSKVQSLSPIRQGHNASGNSFYSKFNINMKIKKRLFDDIEQPLMIQKSLITPNRQKYMGVNTPKAEQFSSNEGPQVLQTTVQRVTPKKGIVYALENGDDITRINITNPFRPQQVNQLQDITSSNQAKRFQIMCQEYFGQNTLQIQELYHQSVLESVPEEGWKEWLYQTIKKRQINSVVNQSLMNNNRHRPEQIQYTNNEQNENRPGIAQSIISGFTGFISKITVVPQSQNAIAQSEALKKKFFDVAVKLKDKYDRNHPAQDVNIAFLYDFYKIEKVTENRMEEWINNYYMRCR